MFEHALYQFYCRIFAPEKMDLSWTGYNYKNQ